MQEHNSNSEGREVLVKDGIQRLIDLNKKHSDRFVGEHEDRLRYRGEHPTEIAALKCMDGRLHLPVITKTPLGIIQPYRNLGGRFNFGWPFFGDLMSDWVRYGLSRGRNCLLLITYHYSRGDHHRGCAGFGYDTDAARSAAMELRKQFERIYPARSVVRAIVCGIETDDDALILHGENNEVVDLAEISEGDRKDVFGMLQRLFPSLGARITGDFLPLVSGNLERIMEVRALRRPMTDVEHREWIIGVGRGFDWFHRINEALIIGPYSPDLSGPIKTAAMLMKSNIANGRVSTKSDLVLLSSAPYRDAHEKPYMIEKAKFLSEYAHEVIAREVPEILSQLKRLTVIVDMNTRLFEVI